MGVERVGAPRHLRRSFHHVRSVVVVMREKGKRVVRKLRGVEGEEGKGARCCVLMEWIGIAQVEIGRVSDRYCVDGLGDRDGYSDNSVPMNQMRDIGRDFRRISQCFSRVVGHYYFSFL